MVTGAATPGTIREVAGRVRVRRKLPANPRLSGELGGGRRGELDGAAGLKTPIDTPDRPDYSTTKWL